MICIDQGNIDEKAIQVERMKDVFREAQTVIASLGPHRNAGMTQEISTCRPKVRKGDLGLKEPLIEEDFTQSLLKRTRYVSHWTEQKAIHLL